MTRSSNKALLQAAADAADSDWNQDGVETLSFDDPNDVNAGGTAHLYGESGVVRLELFLPVARAAEVIEYVRSGRPLLNPCAKFPIADLLTTPSPSRSEAWAELVGEERVLSGHGQSSELNDLIADQARDLAEDPTCRTDGTAEFAVLRGPEFE